MSSNNTPRNDRPSMPLKKITDFHHVGNVYEITSAAILRASQLTLLRDKDNQDSQSYIIAAALEEVLDGKFKYKSDTESEESSS